MKTEDAETQTAERIPVLKEAVKNEGQFWNVNPFRKGVWKFEAEN